ncbi:MAG: sulfatase-like hydrolase/transferase, partial [Rhodobacteraceae bacterium]|nr:sulfatase-like hydrolase/transferase [Paracoccaceae bacterium]
EFVGRSQGKPFFLYFAFNAVHSPLESTDKYQARFPHITDKKRRTYAGMLSALDDAIGRVLAKVRELGQEENTLVMFYSDNGGPTWETTSRNDPLRGFKGQMFEGGIRVPFVAQWKGTIPAGRTYREMVMGFDCHATALAAAGVPADKPTRNDTGQRVRATLDGVNLLPFILGMRSDPPHEQLFWRAGQQHAARVGDWKLVNTRTEPPMLFNLKDDLDEKNDLAAGNPTKLKELQAAFAEWEKGMEAPRWIRQDQSNAEPGGKLRTTAAGKAKAGARIEEAMKSMDKNQDGKLSAGEFLPAAPFKEVDKDGDGFATVEELRAYYTAQRAKAAPKK